MFKRLQCEEVRPPEQQALNGRSGRESVVKRGQPDRPNRVDFRLPLK
jgi:hypothetical protein